MKSKFLLLSLPLLLLSACGNDTTTAKYIVTDQKVTLEEWPDAAYIASLDSILAAEPLKKQAKATTNITMNAHEAPIFKLPPQVTGKKDVKSNKVVKKGEQSKTKDHDAGIISAKAKNSDGAEAFANRFTDGLSKLQSDPNNASLFKVTTATDGEDIMKLLRRTYGSQVLTLPRFFVVGALKSVNPGLNLESLNNGDQVKIPRI